MRIQLRNTLLFTFLLSGTWAFSQTDAFRSESLELLKAFGMPFANQNKQD